MIDVMTYKMMHPEAPLSRLSYKDDLGSEAMLQDDPPGGEFLLLLPAKLFGFNMQDKTWGTFAIATRHR
jgi:hypothetical protein